MRIFFLLLALLPFSAYSQGPDVADVKIHGFIANGDGCPKSTRTAIVTNSEAGSKGADYFQLTFDKFIVEHGPGIPRWENSKNCNIVFNVDFPEGYRFYFDGLEFDGYAEVQRGVHAEFDSRIRVPLQRDQIRFGGVIPGYFEGEYKDVIKGELDRFDSGCAGSTMIKIENNIRMRGKRRDYSVVTVDQASGLLKQAIKVKWEKC